MTPKKPKTGIFLVDVFHSTYLWRISFSFFFCLVRNLPRKNIWGNLSQNSTCYCIDDFQFKKVLFLTFGWDLFARTTMFSGQDSFVYCSILNRLYNNNYEGQVFFNLKGPSPYCNRKMFFNGISSNGKRILVGEIYYFSVKLIQFYFFLPS